MDGLRIKNWHHFVEIADHLDIGPPGSFSYAFRGQSNESWGLTPSLLRHLNRSRLTEEEALKLEALAFDEFVSHAHLLLPFSVFQTTKDTISWWTLMQHHGSPTRLLDWTGSIYVAAYFAVVDDTDCDGSIWLIHVNSLNEKMKQKYGQSGIPTSEGGIIEQFLKPKAPHLVVFAQRRNKTDRMITQQGGFSICRNLLGAHGEIIEEALAGRSIKTLFQKLIIPAEDKTLFIRKLRMMNITATSLFPGLDGLGKSIKELVMLGSK